MMFFCLLFCCLYATTAATRLLPSDGSIVHCAGQSNSAFTAYSKYLNDDTLPAVQMFYLGFGQSTSDITQYFDDMKKTISQYPSYQWVAIQLGLDFNGLSEKIAQGEYDQHILTLISGMQSVDHPFWIRLGYEFNGQWNNYAPKSDYIAAYQRMTDMLRNNSWSNKYVANVWDFSCDASDKDYSSWYPGDKYVDWYGVNVFSGASFPTSSCVEKFVENSCSKQFPIILGESTPRDTGVLNGNTSWNEWFQPYFYDLILQKQNSELGCVRAFCYIDWNWTSTSQWPTWGDAQIQDNEVVGHNYQQTLYKGDFLQATNKSAMLARLGI